MIWSLLAEFGATVVASTVLAGLAIAVLVVALPVDTPAPRWSIWMVAVIIIAQFGAIVALLSLGVWRPLLGFVVPMAPPFVPGVAVVGVFVLGTIAALPGIILASLLRVLHRACTETGASARSVRASAEKNVPWSIAIVVLMAAIYVGMVRAPHPAIAAAVLPAVALLGAQLRAVVVPRSLPTRAPTAAERKQISAATERTGFREEHVYVVDDRPEIDLWRPTSAGFGPFSRVFVPETSIEAMDEDVFETTLVTLTTRSIFGPFRIVALGLFIGVFLTAVLFFDAAQVFLGGARTSPETIAVVSCILIFVLAQVVGRRLLYRADDRVAATLGADRLVSSLERRLDLAGGADADRITLMILLVPSVQRRIDRLRPLDSDIEST